VDFDPHLQRINSGKISSLSESQKIKIMETKEISVEKLGVISGIFVSIALIAYFILMKYMQLEDVAELRWFNLVIQLGSIIFVIRYFKYKTKRRVEYLEGISLSFLTSAVGAILFAAFIYIYFSNNPILLLHLKDNAPMMGEYLTPLTASLTVVVEGLTSALILSFVIMQYFKDDPNHVKEEQKSHPEQG
jgi:hypothetical protein